MNLVAGEPQAVTVRAPAKINLELRVGPARADGYHEIATVFHAVALYDHVTVTQADRWSVQVHGPYADRVPTDRTNLALKAAKALARTSNGQGPVAISIDKQIPVAGGMAGGSADAAAALVACEALWGLGLTRDELAPVAASLGSDVPFLLYGGTALGSGRGERVVPVLATGELHWVLWTSEDAGLSAAEVYAESDRLREGEEVADPQMSEDLVSALRTMRSETVGAALHNDLQPAASSLFPVLAEVIESGLELGAEGAVVSGSGPTVAFLTDSPADALDLAVGLAARGPTGGIHRVSGPVPGAQVVRSGPPSIEAR